MSAQSQRWPWWLASGGIGLFWFLLAAGNGNWFLAAGAGIYFLILVISELAAYRARRPPPRS